MKKLCFILVLLTTFSVSASEKWTCVAKCGFDTGERFNDEGSYQQRVFSVYKIGEGTSPSDAFNMLIQNCNKLTATEITKHLAPNDRWVAVIQRYLSNKSNPIELFSKYEEVRAEWSSVFNYTIADINYCLKH